MKYFLISFFFHFFYSSVILSNDIYETNFHKIEITNENISIAKVREINKIKIISIENIFDKILTKSEKNKLKRLDNLDQSLEYLIKNIIIENEFISKNIYKADIKINYDKDKIINLFRSNKINYSDIQSPIFLIVATEEKALTYNGLSINNSFYNYDINIENNLVQFILPDLSPNDRFITPYNKIVNMDLASLSKLSNKYQSNHILLIYLKHQDNIIVLDLNLFSLKEKNITFIKKLNFPILSDYHPKLYEFINNWWKINNLIDNSEINQIMCEIQNENIEELYTKTSNIRLGAEMNVRPFIIRAGYSRYGIPTTKESSLFSNEEYSSENYSFGLGINNGGYFFDVAYVLSQGNSEHLLYDEDYISPIALVNTNHTLVLTLGFRY